MDGEALFKGRDGLLLRETILHLVIVRIPMNPGGQKMPEAMRVVCGWWVTCGMHSKYM